MKPILIFDQLQNVFGLVKKPGYLVSFVNHINMAIFFKLIIYRERERRAENAFNISFF